MAFAPSSKMILVSCALLAAVHARVLCAVKPPSRWRCLLGQERQRAKLDRSKAVNALAAEVVSHRDLAHEPAARRDERLNVAGPDGELKFNHKMRSSRSHAIVGGVATPIQIWG